VVVEAEEVAAAWVGEAEEVEADPVEGATGVTVRLSPTNGVDHSQPTVGVEVSTKVFFIYSTFHIFP
jgi:hypothetical protein